MKKFNLLTLLWLLGLNIAYAQIPALAVKAQLVNSSWPAHYTVNLTVPTDHHAYLDEGADKAYIPISIAVDNPDPATGLAISKIEKPTGVYETAVKATVLRGQGEFTLWLNQNPTRLLTLNKIPFTVKYQLCNDVTHECFRPKTTMLDLTLPAATLPATASTAQANNTEASLSDYLLTLFKNHHDNTALMFGLMLTAGLLSVATPCVYPMLPITSMFIIKRANGIAEKEKQHALVYLLGIIATYMMLGLMAGMTGGAFNTFMQSAWVNLGFALFFAFFALALLGFYELGFMQSEVYELDQKSSQVSGLAGTWLMGTVAGLVISPCVGPIVFALLLQVADNIAAKAADLALLNQSVGFLDRLMIAGQGSVMMAGFGLGVGLPFFMVSVVKVKKLPKAGYWMNKVKYGFGLLILYFAYIYFAKGMGVLGVEANVTLALAIGLTAIWIAVVYCNVLTLLPTDALPNQKMQHYCGVVSLLMGGWLVIASLNQTPLMTKQQSLSSPLAQTTSAQPQSIIETEAGINWHRSYKAAQKIAMQTGKPIFIDFYASWCANCTAFKTETANNSALNQALRETAIAVKLVDKEPEFEQFRNNPQHRPLKIGLPYFAILSADGQLKWASTDYKATQQMIDSLKTLKVVAPVQNAT
jgi:thiol:disulfide interchange protein DsbD